MTFHHADPGTPLGAWADATGPAIDVEGIARVVVVAAHPDDESLGAGGLLARCARLGVPADVLIATDGDASHPRSPTHSRAELGARRRRESVVAAAAVGVDADRLVHLGVADGAVAQHEDDVVAAIVDLVGDGRGVLLVAPYRGDGHPDHEAAGRAAAIAARRTDARLLEYPIWLLHAAEPSALADAQLVHLALDDAERHAKHAAIDAHASQVHPLSDEPGDEVLLGSHVLDRFRTGIERYVVAPPIVDDRLDRLHVDEQEPWGADRRWYERRKRSLLLAMLPAERLGRVLEVGCSTGVTTAALAARADEVVALDASPAALARAAERTEGLPVRLLLGDVPWTWPDGRFDLVVVSELGYFLSPAALEALVERVAGSLSPHGAVALCHWRHPVRGWVLDADAVHAAFDVEAVPPRAASYADGDVRMELRAHRRTMPDAGR
ncbi:MULTISPECIES: PIG-L family deacetylase [unclassified Agrococcus]|uniref:PIG-L family deacetylase n=1 Tax=unclassified Agrococcus TaxID=2615065 RepID=UPI00361159F6